MQEGILGIHHISAIASDAQRNVEFYTKVLGLRLIKKTVNFDSPNMYHLYYGDEVGSPGTVITFFPFGSNVARGRRGAGQATIIAFSISLQSVEYWSRRLKEQGVTVFDVQSRADTQVISMHDPDGIRLELIAHEHAENRPGWTKGLIPAEHAIRGFYGVTVLVKDGTQTVQFMTEIMGFRLLEQVGHRYRLCLGHADAGTLIDVIADDSLSFGSQSVGNIHHVAWRVRDRGALEQWQRIITMAGRHPTEVKDRNYFESVYFREPGGVLFELATDVPGFTVDEPLDALGTGLKLPQWLESERSALEAQLPPLHIQS